MLARIQSGRKGGPSDRRFGRISGFQFLKCAARYQLLNVGQVTCRCPIPDQVRIDAIESQNDQLLLRMFERNFLLARDCQKRSEKENCKTPRMECKAAARTA